jgi:hypothetical protein
MARRGRNRDLDVFEAVAKLVFLVFFLSLFSPTVRQGLHAVGVIVLILICVATTAGLGFLIYRAVVRKRTLEQSAVNRVEPQVFVSRPTPAVSARMDMSKPACEALKTADLVGRLHAIDWFQFEKIVAITYRKLGHTVTAKGGANPDGGIDLLVGREGVTTAIQCKQWKTWNVGVKAIREFLGALTDAGLQKGIFITLRGYSGDAKQLADKHGIEILNETGLAAMLEATNARFDPETLELLNDTRKFCPKCGREMLIKTAKKGSGAGQQFWACPGYPWKCRYTISLS